MVWAVKVLLAEQKGCGGIVLPTHITDKDYNNMIL